jgi:hypothetical protein
MRSLPEQAQYLFSYYFSRALSRTPGLQAGCTIAGPRCDASGSGAFTYRDAGASGAERFMSIVMEMTGAASESRSSARIAWPATE